MVSDGAHKPSAKRLMSYKLQPAWKPLTTVSLTVSAAGGERGMMGGEGPAAAFPITA